MNEDYRPSREHLSNREIDATGQLVGGAVGNICRELLSLRQAMERAREGLKLDDKKRQFLRRQWESLRNQDHITRDLVNALDDRETLLARVAQRYRENAELTESRDAYWKQYQASLNEIKELKRERDEHEFNSDAYELGIDKAKNEIASLREQLAQAERKGKQEAGL